MKRYSRNRAARRREAEASAIARFCDNDYAPYTAQINPFQDEPRRTMFANKYHQLRVRLAWLQKGFA